MYGVIRKSCRNFVSLRDHVISSISVVSNILKPYLRLAIKEGQGRRGLCVTLPNLACENSRFSSLFAARNVSRGGTSATQPQKFHTDDVNQCLHNISGGHGVPNANCSILRFSWSILVKCCVHLRMSSRKTQMLLLEKTIFHKYWLFC